MLLLLLFHLQAETKAEEAAKRASLAEKMVQLQANMQKPVSVMKSQFVVSENIHTPLTEVFFG